MQLRDDGPAEGGQIPRVAGGDQVVVHCDFLIHPLSTAVLLVVLQVWEGAHEFFQLFSDRLSVVGLFLQVVDPVLQSGSVLVLLL